MSKVVFVGNVPYNMSEDALIDVFKSVGQVVGFRLVFDRDTGKPKGYGFCEFADHETAASAVRNLNNTDVGGRPLRIDLADSDPFLEGKTTVRGELMDAGGPGPTERGSHWRNENRGPDGGDILATIPPGKPLPPGERATEAITHAIAQNMTESQLIEVIAQMKAFVITHPKQAHQFLSNHPQVAYAVFMGLITSNIIARDVLNRMLDNANNRSAPPAHLQPPPPPQTFASPPQLHLQAQHPQHQPYPPPPPRLQQPQPVHGMMPPGMGPPPPPGAMFGHMQPTPPNMPPMPPYYRGPPQPLPPQQPPHLPPQQPPHLAPQPPPQQSNLQPLLQLLRDGGGNNPDAQALYSIVLSLTPAQINELPAAERETIESLRSMLMANHGVA
ncbi:hypothetical protein C8R45DRAFT_1024518 [Mycena sanguinolenta]|nr:hypothetical protein C8R45DRAFT_1024518 [Mycena sanguinolenta]